MDDAFSLLSKSSSGGEYASRGFGFQNAVLLQFIPEWLKYESFTGCIKEGLDDIEAKFWSTTSGFQKERIQIKRQVIARTQFDEIISAYLEQYRVNPNSYRWFSIICNGVAPELQSLVNGLRRIRSPYAFYSDDQIVVSQSYEEFVQRVGDSEKADFIFQRVRIQVLPADLESSVRAVVRTAIGDHFGITDSTLIEQGYQNLLALIQSRTNEAIWRNDLEEAIGKFARSECVYVFTATTEMPAQDEKPIVFDWNAFDGNIERNYPPSETWNNVLLAQLLRTKTWLNTSRNTKCINLLGQRRLTAATAFGYTFSAVSGFRVKVNYRGQIWSTDDHSDSATPPYNFSHAFYDQGSDHLIVTISIASQRIQDAVDTYVLNHFQGSVSRLHLWSDAPIVSSQQANLAVSEIKSHLTDATSVTGAKYADLFLAVPSPFALFLGHRLNATVSIQLYEWVGDSDYTPTCYLT